ncbi:14341_t:CDS:1, partial [Funneliformis mosseae]
TIARYNRYLKQCVDESCSKWYSDIQLSCPTTPVQLSNQTISVQFSDPPML